MQTGTDIREVYRIFSRNNRWYCLFSVTGRTEEFLYYTHDARELRSLMFGNDFRARLPHLMENEELCIECGLGLAVMGGIALDNGDCIAWNCETNEANGILTRLKAKLGDAGGRVRIFG
jgi:hypothetical protein